jgi:hypothetical protein
MKIKNISSSNIILSDIKDAGGRETYVYAGQEVVIYDEDAEKSGSLRQYILDGYIIKIGDEEPGEGSGVEIEKADKIIDWIISRDQAIQFTDPINGTIENDYAGVHGTPVVVGLAVTDGAGVIDTFKQGATIVVTIDAGTIDGVAGPVTKTLVNGEIAVSINRATAGDVNITLSGGNTSLDKSDIAKVTFS